MKNILFKASSPFTNFTAMLIGTLYYPNDRRILLLDCEIYEGFRDNLLELGFFDEVCIISETNKTVEHVEKEIDIFLSKRPNIDEYFMNTFSDCYSLMIAYRLFGKAVLHIFPEGSTTIQLEKVLDLIIERSDVTSNDNVRRHFFEKYPMNLDLFDFTWLYDMDIPQGDFRAERRHIDIDKLMNSPQKDRILNGFNQIFQYSNKQEIRICLLDTFLVDADFLEYRREQDIIDVLLSSLSEERLIIKPHPPESMLPYAKWRYKGDNVDILDSIDVPWELIFLNIINEGQKSLKLFTFQLEGTFIMTSVAFMPSVFDLEIISLNKLEKNYMSQYYSVSHDLNYEYFVNALKKKKVRLTMPESIEQLLDICSKISKKCITHHIEEREYPVDYFLRVGNLIADSYIYDELSGFFARAYFSYLKDDIEVIFDIEKDVQLRRITWRPSTANIFTSVENMNVSIIDGGGKRASVLDYDSKLVFLRDGRIDVDLHYIGYCKRIEIKSRLSMYKKFSKMYKSYYEMCWRSSFWEQWCTVIEAKCVEKMSKSGDFELIWIYGHGKIGLTISREFKRNNIEHFFVVSKGTVSVTDIDGTRVLSAKEAYEKKYIPKLIIITPMNDFDEISFSMPYDIKNVRVSLQGFLDILLNKYS